LQGDKFLIYGGSLNLVEQDSDYSIGDDPDYEDRDDTGMRYVNDVLLLCPFGDEFCKTAALKGRCPLTLSVRITLVWKSRLNFNGH
jgi:hypothetical protein